MKIIKGLLTLVLILSVTMCLFACSSDEDENVAPYQFDYTFKKVEDDDGNVTDRYYIISGFSISAEASDLLNKNDYDALADLFNTEVKDDDGDIIYSKPETPYTAETVRYLTIPTTYKNRTVKKIADEAFMAQTLFTKVSIGDNIENIGSGAFAGCSNLAEITIPYTGECLGAVNANKEFGYIFGTVSDANSTSTAQTYGVGSSTTFYIPTSLKKVTVTKGNTISSVTKYFKEKTDDDGKKYTVEVTDADEITAKNYDYSKDVDTSVYAVPAYSFYGCTTITNVTLAGQMTSVEPYTFYGCTGLLYYSFADSVTKINAYAFNGCTSLKNVNLNKVDEICEDAFNGCTSLGNTTYGKNDVIINASIVGESAFTGCTAMQTVEFTKKVTLGKNAFSACTKLVEIKFDIAGSVIGDYAFTGCTMLKSVDLSNVNLINAGAFYGCSALTTVKISTNPTIIGNHAFGNCEDLEAYYIYSNTTVGEDNGPFRK